MNSPVEQFTIKTLFELNLMGVDISGTTILLTGQGFYGAWHLGSLSGRRYADRNFNSAGLVVRVDSAAAL